jgi:hypothetical protein
MTPQPTPGPWKSGKGGDNNPRIYNKYGTVICQFHNGSGEEYHGFRNAEANARLIAAAPEMLATLHKIGYEPWGHAEASHAEVLREVVAEVRALLARIEGKE